MPDFTLADFEHGSPVPDYRLSDARIRFRLAYYAESAAVDAEPVTLDIREPLGWDASEWTLTRDPEYHGMSFEYSGKETILKFQEKAAVAFIEAAYNNDGPTANVQLSWFLTYKEEVLTPQVLRLILSKRTKRGGELTAPCERVGVHYDLKTKWDTQIAMDAVKTLDDKPITPPSTVQLLLHAQTISQQTKWVADEKRDSGWFTFVNTSNFDYRTFWLSFPLENPDPDEITSETKGSENGVSIDSPYSVFQNILKPRDGGTYTFDIDLDFTFDLTMQKRSISINPPDIKDWYLDVFLRFGDEEVRIGTRQSGTKNSRFLDGVRFYAKATITKTIQADTPVYLYGLFRISPSKSSWKGTETRLVTNKCSVNIKASTSANATIVDAFKTIDVLKHLYAALTGRTNAIQSAYYSLQSELQPVDGSGARRLQLNGFTARGFKPGKPLQISLEKQIQSLQAIDCIGFAIKPTDAGDVLVIEPAPYFYRYTEVLALPSYSIVEEETETPVLYGKVNVGYSKFPDEGPQVLDEFNTKHEYNTPLRSETVYDAVSDLIASGYALELTRREQFAEKPSDSTKYDDECFIVCALPPTETAHVATVVGDFHFRLSSTLTIIGELPPWIAVGSAFAVTGSLYNNNIFIVHKLTALAPQGALGGGTVPKWSLSIGGLVRMETGTFTLTAVGESAQLWQAERDEAFSVLSGLTDPKTAYNLRISPRFNLLRHAPVLAGGLVYKDGGKLLTLQFAKQNAGLITQLAESAEGEDNINVRKYIQHNDPINVTDLRWPIPPLWRPEVVTVSTALTLDQMMYLRACYQGTHPDPTKHLGYITLTGNEDAGIPTIQGWPMSITYNLARKEAKIRLRKLYIPKGGKSPADGCEFYATYTFGDFENLPPGTLPPWIYECIFGVFQ